MGCLGNRICLNLWNLTVRRRAKTSARAAILNSPIQVALLSLIALLLVYDSVMRTTHPDIRYAYSYHGNPTRSLSYRTRGGSSGGNKTVTPVLLMTYMRGGSSLLGEMLNRNPQAMYWFEPFDGVYSDLYGSRHGWFPIDLLYDDYHRLRLFTEYEEGRLLDLVRGLVNCDVTALPTDTLAHFAMTRIRQKQLHNYTECLISVDQGTNKHALKYADKNGKITPPWACKLKIAKHVPRHFSTADKALVKSWYCLHMDPSSPYRSDQSSVESSDVCEPRAELYREYAKCMDNYRAAISTCMPQLEEACHGTNIVGMKAIRLRADLVQQMMQDNPDLKVVYEIRDPRGIVLSRKQTGLISVLANKNLTREALLLCQRIAFDLSIVHNMEKEFPERVLKLRYEDLVMEANRTTDEFYSFLDMQVPGAVRRYVVDGGREEGDTVASYSTAHKNGSAAISSWRQKLSEQQITEMTAGCLDVLEYFGYPTDIS